ncbi:hypothetical protein HGB13_01105 [bacterium]|nr:hypothetical protein [bacterium]
MLKLSLILASALNGVDTCANGSGTCNPPDLNDVTKVITNVLNIALGLIGTVALLFLIQGGILYMTSGGNPDQTSKAKNIIFYAIIGLVVAIVSWSIISFITNVFI